MLFHGKFRYTLASSETFDGSDVLSVNHAYIETKIAYNNSWYS